MIYGGDCYELSTILRHGPSGQMYELRLPIKSNKDEHSEFELSIKHLKIKSYIDILGLPIIDADVSLLPLDLKIETALTISQP